MKKLLITILFVFVMVGLTVLYIYKTQNTTPQSDENVKQKTTNVMTGKITEVISDNEIFIEITKERGNLFLGDIVKVQCEAVLIDELNILDVPQSGDVISLLYVEDDLKEEDTNGLQYSLSAKKVYKHISDNIVEIQITEIIDDNTVSAKVIDEDYDDESKLKIIYDVLEIAGSESDGYEVKQGKPAVGDKVHIQYADDEIEQKEDYIEIRCRRMVK